MDLSNQEIARLLHQVAAALEVKRANKFRVSAYDRAAIAIEHSSSEVKDIFDEGKLEEIPGVGLSLAKYLDELMRTGKVKHFESILQNLPPAMFVFLEVPGIGPQTALKLAKNLKIARKERALDKLWAATKKGQISQIEGFGAQTEASILKKLQSKSVKDERRLLPYAWQTASRIIKYLRQLQEAQKIEPLGSLRRKVATIGDIDLAVATDNPKKVIDHFVAYPGAQIIAQGENTARIILSGHRQIDLKTSKPKALGALLQHYTGSKQHNIHLREYAKNKGLSLSEYGIKRQSRIKNYESEESFYHDLGMEWIPPELREDAGEIEASLKRRLPKLIEPKEIKGDLHTHASFEMETSHDKGLNSFEEMIAKAKSLGYEYLGFAEHNPSQSQHSKDKIVSLIKAKKAVIEKHNYSIRVYNGLEIDIKPDGSLALPEEAFAYLDYAIASIHSNFGLSKEAMTKRVLKGLNQPKVKILAHPTGRMLGKREGYELDWNKIFDFCLKNDKWLEINGWPNRLDLPDFLVREAVKKGVKMIVNTDAHAVEDLSLMEYGVSVARRGWAEKNAIINTLPLKAFNDRLLT